MGLGTLGWLCWIVSYGCFANQVPLPPMFSDFSCEVRAVKCFPLSRCQRQITAQLSEFSPAAAAAAASASDSKSNAKGGDGRREDVCMCEFH